MNLLLARRWQVKDATLGELFIDGVLECYTLEDAIRAVKVPGETCIPAGTYPVVIDYSQRFKRLMPHVLNVPGFTGIRIHPGNGPADTEGCILVGRILDRSEGKVLASRSAFEALMVKLREALAKGTVTLTVENPPVIA